MVEEVMTELCWHQYVDNRQTSEQCYELAVGIASTMLKELEYQKKATEDYISQVSGIYSQKMTKENEKEAYLGMRANNDPCGGNFATFTVILCSVGCICIDLASTVGIGQSRYNKGMNCGITNLVTGRKSQKDSQPSKPGLFHQLSEKL